jgi:hypothetical protein
MKNNLAEEGLTVHVRVYSAAGEEQYLQAVSLAPRQTAIVNLNNTIAALPASVAARLGKQGSAKLTFTSPHPSNLMGAITVTNPERGIAWNFRLYPSFPELPTAPVRGLFWLYDGETDGLVAAQNASEEFITLHSSFDVGGASHPLPPVPLAPGQSFLLSLRRELERLGLAGVTVGGIEFTYEGPGDAVQAHGALSNQNGFSAEIDFHRFTRWEERRDFTQRTPRFALGPADPALGLPAPTVFEPVLLLHNFNRHPLEATLAVGYRTADGPQETQIPVQLAAGESQIFALTEHLSGVVPADAHWASLELGYSDWHNGLAAALVSVSRDGEHTLNSVLNWVLASSNEGWYWQVDADHNTLIAIYNRDTAEATVAVSLDYAVDGNALRYDLPERVIPGRATEMFDVGAILAAAVPDEDGDLIPESITFGGYRVRKLEPDLTLTLTTEALVYDRRRKNYLSLYNTGTCYNSVNLLPGSITGPVGALAEVVLFGFNTTTEEWEELPVPTYSSQNSAIASINSAGIVELEAPGSTTVKGQKLLPKTIFYDCSMQTMSDTSPVTVKPVIDSISPMRGLIGATTNVTITGDGLGSNPSVNAGSGISVTVSSATSTQISASFIIATDAAAGNHSVTVTVSGQTSNAVNFFVQVPTSLSVLSVVALPTGTSGDYGCTPSEDFGIQASVNYRVNDQSGVAVASSEMRPQEQLLNLVVNGDNKGNPSPDWRDIGPSRISGTSQFTSSSGTFLDAPYGACSSGPVTVTFTQPISVLVGSQARYTLRTNNTSITSASQGHGSISNGSDIQMSR